MTYARGTVVVGYLDGGEWAACFGMSYRDLCLRDAMESQRIVRVGGRELRHVTGTGGIASGRNKVVQDFLDNSDGEWLFFIDTDMGFANDTVDRLVEAADKTHRPVMGALAFQLRRTPEMASFYGLRYSIAPTLFTYREIKGEVGFAPIHDYERDSVVTVAGTGAACILIHRRVLREMREKYGDIWFDQITHPTGGGNGKPRTFGEDLSFCVRLASMQIPVHVDTSIKTTHYKHAMYLDEELYESSRK